MKSSHEADESGAGDPDVELLTSWLVTAAAAAAGPHASSSELVCDAGNDTVATTAASDSPATVWQRLVLDGILSAVSSAAAVRYGPMATTAMEGVTCPSCGHHFHPSPSRGLEQGQNGSEKEPDFEGLVKDEEDLETDISEWEPPTRSGASYRRKSEPPFEWSLDDETEPTDDGGGGAKKWTKAETQMLVASMNEAQPLKRKWSFIKKRTQLRRNNVQIKDKWRNLVKYGRVGCDASIGFYLRAQAAPPPEEIPLKCGSPQPPPAEKLEALPPEVDMNCRQLTPLHLQGSPRLPQIDANGSLVLESNP